MGKTIDKIKGRAKETAGDVKDDPKMQAEGKAERAGAKLREKAEEAADRVKGAVRSDRPDDQGR